ncbi:unnamed protein product, partial [Nesidiocoris tenuis]
MVKFEQGSHQPSILYIKTTMRLGTIRICETRINFIALKIIRDGLPFKWNVQDFSKNSSILICLRVEEK